MSKSQKPSDYKLISTARLFSQQSHTFGIKSETLSNDSYITLIILLKKRHSVQQFVPPPKSWETNISFQSAFRIPIRLQLTIIT